MNAYKFGDEIGLVFTKVLDEMPLGLVEEDEEVKEVTNREYWLKRGTQATVKMADEMLEIINSFKSGYELKYNKFYIGLAINGQPNNFAIFKPQKNNLRFELRLPKSDEIDQLIQNNELDETGYDKSWGAYKLRLIKGEIGKKKEILQTLLEEAERNFND